MTLLKNAIKAALENRPVRENLGDQISIHVNKLIFTSLFDLGTAGEGLLYHAGRHLGSTFVEMSEVRGKTVETVLNSLIELLNRLELGKIELVEVDEDSALITLHDCYFCSALPETGRGVCFYEVGIFSGALFTVLNREFNVIETKCHCMGDRVCEYEISGK